MNNRDKAPFPITKVLADGSGNLAGFFVNPAGDHMPLCALAATVGRAWVIVKGDEGQTADWVPHFRRLGRPSL